MLVLRIYLYYPYTYTIKPIPGCTISTLHPKLTPYTTKPHAYTTKPYTTKPYTYTTKPYTTKLYTYTTKP